MSESNPIRIFVSHDFQESDDYLRVFEFLESVDSFFYINCSKPEAMSESDSLDDLKEELIKQIKECEAVVILASLYIDQTELIRFQMDIAGANGKPMIAIRPFGGVAESPEELIGRVVEHTHWNEREIADSLKRQARLEDTARWETIEFTLD